MASAKDELWREGYDILAARIGRIPAQLLSVLDAPAPALHLGLNLGSTVPRQVIVTGVGSSAAHARFLVHLLQEELQVRSRFLPLAGFLPGPPCDSRSAVLVVFSQGLAPNAWSALEQLEAWHRVVVVTAVGSPAPGPGAALHASHDPAHDLAIAPSIDTSDEKHRRLARLAARGARVVHFPEANEYGTLLRVIGPMCGYAAAWQILRAVRSECGQEEVAVAEMAVAEVASLAATLERARSIGASANAAIDFGWFDAEAGVHGRGREIAQIGLLASGEYSLLVDNLRQKLQEGLLLPEPPIWDWLQFAHGPFQQLRDRRCVILALTKGTDACEAALVQRVRGMLNPDRQRLIELAAIRPGPMAILEHEAMLNEVVLRGIAALQIDQVRWPGKGADAPLYEVAGTQPAVAPRHAARLAGDNPWGAAGTEQGAEPGGARRGERESLRSQSLQSLTWPLLESSMASGRHTAVLALGATEQHGPHLPFSTDTTIATALAERFCRRVPEGIALPVLALGCSREHMGFVGTLSLEPATLGLILDDVATSLAGHGFEGLVVFSAHGGNTQLLREWEATSVARFAPLRLFVLHDLPELTRILHAAAAARGVSSGAAGHHAGEVETSILAWLEPSSIAPITLSPGLMGVGLDPQAIFYPSLRDASPTGTVGDPSASDAARGREYLEVWVDALVEAYRLAKNRQ